MRPPICALCNARAANGGVRDSQERDHELVEFADFQPLPPGMVGHPRGYEWFCKRHLAAAQKWKHLPFAEALRQLLA